MNLRDVTADTIQNAFKDKLFEHFVRCLLRTELECRHAPTAQIRGPAATYHRDAQRDLIVTIKSSPRTPRDEFRYSLTWDEFGSTIYSCKGGSGWRKSFLTGLGNPSSPKPKSRPRKVLDHLLAGGRLAFVVAEGTIDDSGLLEAVAKRLSQWLSQEDKSLPSLADQLTFIDGGDLADFINTYLPASLTAEMLSALRVDIFPDLLHWDQWTAEFVGQRDFPTFESDPQRDAILSAIKDESKRVIQVFGPPGAGKTRVIHQGILQLGEDARAKTRYGKDLEDLSRLSHWLREAGAINLILDELRTVDVAEIEPLFAGHAHERARLFLVGTSDDGTREYPGRSFALGVLDNAAIERLVQHEFPSGSATLSPEKLDKIRSLSEGYPWYAVLLAKSIAGESPDFEGLDSGASEWNYGARRVLAGSPRKYSPNAWEREAELRAKCLLVAMMARELELDWDEIWRLHGVAIARAIDEESEWEKVKKLEKACRERHLLRVSGLRARRRYVSPNNLARLILDRYFTDPDLGPRIRRYTPQFRASLLTIAKAVYARPAVVESLANGECSELQRRARDEGIASFSAYLSNGTATYLAALEAPERIAVALGLVIQRFTDEDLQAAPTTRSALRSILTHVIHRSIGANAFLAAEAALLRLARIDDEPWANNSIASWKSMFLPVLHQTHQAWELRFKRLEERLSDVDHHTRVLALDALADAADAQESGLGYTENDQLDGGWPRHPYADVLSMKGQLWDRLLGACELNDSELAGRARRAVAENFRSSLGHGMNFSHVSKLSTLVQLWTSEERQALAEKVADVRRYDADDSQVAPILVAVEQLEDAMAPSGLHERILAQVATWHPGPLAINDKERPTFEEMADRKLAQEVVDTPEAQASTLQWLTEPHACRSRPFFRALGFVDHDAVLRPRVAALVQAGAAPQVLGDYLLGRADAEGPENTESWLKECQEERLHGAAIWYLSLQTPSAARLQRIRELLAAGGSGEGLAFLPYRGWVEDVATDPMLEFVGELMQGGRAAEPALSLLLRMLKKELGSSERACALDLLERCIELAFRDRAVIGMQYEVEQGILALASNGRIEKVAQTLLVALATDQEMRNISMGLDLLKALLAEGYGQALWNRFSAGPLQASPVLVFHLSNSGIIHHVNPESVLEWVGLDASRGHMIAQLTNPYGRELSEIVRQLLIRFGPEGNVADALERRARSTPGAISGGLSVFDQRQRDNARLWSMDPQAAVAKWAHRLAESFSESVAEHEARSAFRHRYG